MVFRQLLDRLAGWYFHLSRWAKSTVKRLINSRFSLFPKDSSSTATWAISTSANRPARKILAVSIVHSNVGDINLGKPTSPQDSGGIYRPREEILVIGCW
jgi:hypothetical protein